MHADTVKGLVAPDISNLIDRLFNLFNDPNFPSCPLVIEKSEDKAIYRDHVQLEIIYYGLLTEYINLDTKKEGNDADKNDKKNNILYSAYVIALLLHHVYKELLNCTQKTNQIYENIKKIQNKLELDCIINQEEKQEKKIQIFGMVFRYGARELRTDIFIFFNTCRLWLVRFNRLFIVLGSMFNQLYGFSNFLKNLFIYIHFPEIGVAIYLPRLLLNLFLLFIHVIPNSRMSAQEKQLGFWLRLQIQWERRRYSILNDAVWAGINLTCILVSPVLSLTLTVALYVFDVAIAVWAYYTTKCHIDAVLNREDSKNLAGIEDYSLKELLWEKRNQIIIAVIFLIAMSTLLPWLSSPLVLLAVCGVINLVLTTVQIVWSKKISAKNPQPYFFNEKIHMDESVHQKEIKQKLE